MYRAGIQTKRERGKRRDGGNKKESKKGRREGEIEGGSGEEIGKGRVEGREGGGREGGKLFKQQLQQWKTRSLHLLFLFSLFKTRKRSNNQDKKNVITDKIFPRGSRLLITFIYTII